MTEKNSRRDRARIIAALVAPVLASFAAPQARADWGQSQSDVPVLENGNLRFAGDVIGRDVSVFAYSQARGLVAFAMTKPGSSESVLMAGNKDDHAQLIPRTAEPSDNPHALNIRNLKFSANGAAVFFSAGADNDRNIYKVNMPSKLFPGSDGRLINVGRGDKFDLLSNQVQHYSAAYTGDLLIYDGSRVSLYNPTERRVETTGTLAQVTAFAKAMPVDPMDAATVAASDAGSAQITSWQTDTGSKANAATKNSVAAGPAIPAGGAVPRIELAPLSPLANPAQRAPGSGTDAVAGGQSNSLVPQVATPLPNITALPAISPDGGTAMKVTPSNGANQAPVLTIQPTNGSAPARSIPDQLSGQYTGLNSFSVSAGGTRIYAVATDKANDKVVISVDAASGKTHVVAGGPAFGEITGYGIIRGTKTVNGSVAAGQLAVTSRSASGASTTTAIDPRDNKAYQVMDTAEFGSWLKSVHGQFSYVPPDAGFASVLAKKPADGLNGLPRKSGQTHSNGY